MYEVLAHKISKNMKLKRLLSDFIQTFYSTKSDLGAGSQGWEQLMRDLWRFHDKGVERDEEVLNRYTQDLQKSPTVLTAGKFLVFNYTTAKGIDSSYFVMVVSAFGGHGVYSNSNTKNELLTCFLIDSATNLNTLGILANVLQESVDPRVKTYNFLSNMKTSRSLFKRHNKKRGLSRDGLDTLFPKNKFRTFKLNIGMESIYEVETNG